MSITISFQILVNSRHDRKGQVSSKALKPKYYGQEEYSFKISETVVIEYEQIINLRN